MKKQILMPLPSLDFDPTETAIPWSILTHAGINVTFSTPNAKMGICDQRMLTGESLGILSPLLAANKEACFNYKKMIESKEFKNPISWNEIKVSDYAGIILAGGHAKGMREYLASPLLQNLVSDFFKKDLPLGPFVTE